MCLCVVRIGVDRLATYLERLLKSVKADQTHGHGIEIYGIIGHQLEASANNLKRLLELRLRHHPVRKIGPRFQVVRFEVNGTRECLYRIFLLSDVCCCNPEKV